MTHLTPDLILVNANIYTVDPALPRAEAIAVASGRITAVGHTEEIAALAGPHTVTRDLEGAFVMPGLVDVHNHHFQAGSEELFALQLPIGAHLAEIVSAVRDHAATLPAEAWIVGGPWASDRLSEINSAEALAQLDAAAGGRPVMLSDDSHHNRWVNSRAMAIAGVSVGQPGVVVDAEGRPTGVLYEAAGLPVARAQ